MTLKDKRIFITGSSRGIGRAIALRAAKDGACITLAAKTDTPHPKLEGTIHTVAAEIEAAGGKALPQVVDIRFEEQIQNAVAESVKAFGGIDILINNASAIFIANTENTPLKRYDLMMDVNVRGTFVTSQACLPHLRAGVNPHILNLSPPLNMKPKWFKDHCAYSMSKYGMSMCVLGMAEEFKSQGIGVNALWPRTTIATAAIKMLGGDPYLKRSRKPEIVADAAHRILIQDGTTCTGNFFVVEDVLEAEGITDFSSYAVDPGQPPIPDFFLD